MKISIINKIFQIFLYTLAFLGIGFALSPGHSFHYEQILMIIIIIIIVCITVIKNNKPTVKDKSHYIQVVIISSMGTILATIAWLLGNYKDLAGGLRWLFLAYTMFALLYFVPDIARKLKS